MMPLAHFQDQIARLLLADDPVSTCPAGLATLIAQRAFAVYRNTVVKGCVDALQANYPAIARLVGDEWFRAAAAIHVRASPPHQATLLLYGEDFADFLARFAPAAELPYLAGVARVERMWTEAHAAADAPPVQASSVASLSPERLARVRLAPHPSARWAWFDAQPIRTIWRRNRAPSGDAVAPSGGGAEADLRAHDAMRNPGTAQGDDALNWQGEGILLVRPVDRVVDHPLELGGCALLEACARGANLAQAADAALRAQAETDLAALMAHLLAAGAFAAPVAFERLPESPNGMQEIE